MDVGLRKVWGCDRHVFAFYSNRDMAVLDVRHHDRAMSTIAAMGFDADKDAKWWVDIHEKVCRREPAKFSCADLCRADTVLISSPTLGYHP